MHIDRIRLRNFRTFDQTDISFVNPDRELRTFGMFRKVDVQVNGADREHGQRLPEPRLRNVNLLLGDNGSGKTTLLKAIALAGLGPVVRSSGIYPDGLVRREPLGGTARKKRPTTMADVPATPSVPGEAVIDAQFVAHEQDVMAPAHNRDLLRSSVRVTKRGDLEELSWHGDDPASWEPVYSANSQEFFIVGYGASRRVEKREKLDIGGRRSTVFPRAQRVMSLFEEAYSLIPLSAWLPAVQSQNEERYQEIIGLINRLLGKKHCVLTGDLEAGEYVFRHRGVNIPFPSLSDGFRAFVGWVGDLLYHLNITSPSWQRLVDIKGVVMVDEIDLHLHPSWQMSVLPTLSNELPSIQFVVSSHSPLVASSLEWMNILVMRRHGRAPTTARRLRGAVRGLDADQMLLTDFFGLTTTRAEGRDRALKELSQVARSGDPDAALRLLRAMSGDAEAVP